MSVTPSRNRMNLVLIIFSFITVLGKFAFQKYVLRAATVFARITLDFNTQRLTALRQTETIMIGGIQN